MSRDFEQEFKELKQSEIPDLWNRIEAGLSERPLTAPIAAGGTVSGGQAAQTEQYAQVKRPAWRRWGTLAAACLGVAIILPALTILFRNGGEKSGTTAADTPAATPSTDTAAPADEAPTMEWTAEDTAAADDAGMNGEAYAGMTEGASTETAEAAEEETADMATAGAVSEDADTESGLETPTQGKEMAKNDLYAAIKDGQVLEGIVLQITGAENTNAGSSYQAVVVQADAEGILSDGITIDIICNSDTEYTFPRGLREDQALRKGEDYEVSLRYDNGEFVVVTAGKVG